MASKTPRSIFIGPQNGKTPIPPILEWKIQWHFPIKSQFFRSFVTESIVMIWYRVIYEIWMIPWNSFLPRKSFRKVCLIVTTEKTVKLFAEQRNRNLIPTSYQNWGERERKQFCAIKSQLKCQKAVCQWFKWMRVTCHHFLLVFPW